jgi:hypothetical protein
MKLGVALLVLAAQDPVTTAEGAASVSPMSGELRVWRGVKKKLEAVGKAIQLEPGDRVGSAKGEPVSLMAEEDIVLSLKGVRVNESAGLVLARTEAGLVVKLKDGTLMVDAFERPLTVETAAGKVTGKQACFLVEVKDGVSKVTAIDGALTFSTGVGEVKVEAGRESSAKAGAEPSEPKPATTVAEPGAAAGNLVKNPGFEEEPAVGWKKLDVDGRQRVLDDKVFVSGKRSMRITTNPSNTEREAPPKTSSVWIEQRPTLVKGRRYLVRVYTRLQVRKGTMKVALGIGGVRPNNPDLADMYWHTAEVGDAWKMLRVVVQATNEKGEIALRLVIDDADFDATLWADDWSMVELPDLPKK